MSPHPDRLKVHTVGYELKKLERNVRNDHERQRFVGVAFSYNAFTFPEQPLPTRPPSAEASHIYELLLFIQRIERFTDKIDAYPPNLPDLIETSIGLCRDTSAGIEGNIYRLFPSPTKTSIFALSLHRRLEGHREKRIALSNEAHQLGKEIEECLLPSDTLTEDKVYITLRQLSTFSLQPSLPTQYHVLLHEYEKLRRRITAS
ncbi:hypothetical protein HZB00_04040 [Candidatus Woesearchaeota archaeon]|nr:hypothetical protein [Candidatus Woesearchaeota archaeon]